MRALGFILTLLCISFNGLAQEKILKKRSDLKGPAYKNYNPSKYKTQSITVYSKKTDTKLQGPAYKNQGIFNKATNVQYIAISFSGTERQKLKGPAYKNYKH